MTSDMFETMTRLFPICRSLTGNGVRDTFRILQEIVPIELFEVPSGTQAFDWTVPLEWNVHDAYVLDASGKRIIDFDKNNLHLVGYSQPFEGSMGLEELNKHLYSLPEQPDVIPYITSYYEKRWGFCLSHTQREQLTEQTYTVKVDTTLAAGSMTMGELIIPGKSEKQILLSTYICHPSMANNELSGPVLATYLARRLMKRDNYYTYRFVFVPETIGAITYLSRHRDLLREQVIAGYVMTCVGDPGPYSYLESRLGNTLVDRVTAHVFKHMQHETKWYSWRERGSDERQYCWPGIDLPVGALMRTKYGCYPEYHTSADNLSFVTSEALAESLKLYERCLEVLEFNRTYQCTVLCEPQLGRRGLYPTLSTRTSGLATRDLMDIMAYSDGTTDLLSIADRLNKPIWELYTTVSTLITAGLLKDGSHRS